MKNYSYGQIVILLLALFAEGAFAAKASLRTGALVGSSGSERVYVNVEPSGKILITRSDFTQSTSPAPILEEPTIIQDARPMDGALRLKVGDAELDVGSGDTMDGSISYVLTVGKDRIELKPIVYFDIQ